MDNGSGLSLENAHRPAGGGQTVGLVVGHVGVTEDQPSRSGGASQQLGSTRKTALPQAPQMGRSSSAYETDRRRKTPSLVIVY